MQELIKIESTPALLSVNFDEVRAQLSTELKKYDVVVTQDTVKDAKALITELNKTKKEISDKRKEVVAAVSAPVKAFDTQMKELEAMCTAGGQSVRDQIAKFETETKAVAMEKCINHLEATWDKLEVEPSFRSAKIDDLVNLSTLTAKGNLTGKVQSAIQERVMQNKALQDQTDMRLLKLENESYKAGLSAPLDRGHVESFLFDDEESYQAKLARLFQGELKREQIAQENMRRKIEQEQQQAQSAPETVADPEPEPEPATVQEQAPHVEPTPIVPSQAGHIPVLLTCTFKSKMNPRLTDEQAKEMLRARLEDAGITTLDTITIQRFSAEQEPQPARAAI